MSVREAKQAPKTKRPRIKRTPKPRATTTARIPARWKIHPDYNDCPGKWYPAPASLRMLGKKMPSGCSWALMNFINASMNDNYRAGHEYSDVPAAKWSDNRVHGLATAPMSIRDLAEEIGFSLRAVEYNLSDILKRGAVARMVSEDRLFQFTVSFLHFHEVLDPEAEPDPGAGQEAAAEPAPEAKPDEIPTEEKPKARFKARGSERIETPPISGLVLSEDVAKQVSFDFEVVAGEMRINRFELLSAGQTEANGQGETGAKPQGELQGEEKGNAEGEKKANAMLIPEGLRENTPQFITVSTALPFLAPEEPETSAIIEAVESLRARTGKPLSYAVRVSGDYIEVAISPRVSGSGDSPAPPPRPSHPDSIAPILEAFLPAGGILSESDARRLLRNCQGATAVEIGARAAQLIPDLVAAKQRGAFRTTVVGVLLKQLPEFFQGEGVDMWRRDRQTKEDEAADEEQVAEQERELREYFAQKKNTRGAS